MKRHLGSSANGHVSTLFIPPRPSALRTQTTHASPGFGKGLPSRVLFLTAALILPHLITKGNGVKYAIWFMAPAWLCRGGMHSATAGRDCTTWHPGRSATNSIMFSDTRLQFFENLRSFLGNSYV